MKNLADQLQVKDLLPVSTVSANGLSSAIDLQQLDGEIALLVDSSAGSGNMTLDLKLQHSDTSGGTYTDVPNGSLAQITTSASVQKLSLVKDDLKQFVKLSKTVGGTGPSFLVSAKIVGLNKYHA